MATAKKTTKDKDKTSAEAPETPQEEKPVFNHPSVPDGEDPVLVMPVVPKLGKQMKRIIREKYSVTGRKPCWACNKAKPFSHFYSNTANKVDGTSPKCKECSRKLSPEKQKEQDDTIAQFPGI